MAEAARRDEDWPATVEEFQLWHARQSQRWEFIDGRPRLMAPASLDRTIIKGNVYRLLADALRERGCTAWSTALRS